MTKALVVIDLQHDYFPGGAFPLWNAEATLATIEAAIRRARDRGIPVVLVQHVADDRLGVAPFFNRGTAGAEVHARIRAAAPEAPIIVKGHADAFAGTTLAATLTELGATDLVLCGMMTQNCVTHTALSRSAEAYGVSILVDGCTTVSEILHQLALHAISTRVPLVPSSDAI